METEIRNTGRVDADCKALQALGFKCVSMAEFRRVGPEGYFQTLELFVKNRGFWVAHRVGWEGPLVTTAEAAFVSAEVAEWGGPMSMYDQGMASATEYKRYHGG